MKKNKLVKQTLVCLFLSVFVNLNISAQSNHVPLQKISVDKDHNTHTCGNPNQQEEPIWVNSPSVKGANNKSILVNVRAYTQSIHNVIAKWDVGSCQSFSFGTTPGGNNIRWGQALSSAAKHSGGHSYEQLRRSALAMGTTFNIGDVFYLSLNAGGVLDTAFQLQFVWEDLGNPANVVTINVETNYGVGGAGPYNAAQATKLMDFYNLVNPIIKQVYGPPSRNHVVNVVNDGFAMGVNVYYNGPNQISSNANNYVDVNNDLNQPRLMIHELVHAYRDNVGVSSDSTWHYKPVLSGFEEGMAEGVALIVMDIFAQQYPNFWNGDRHKIHWNQARGMPFEWNYDFENHTQITTQDYWSSDQATGSHWIRYGIGATAMKKMYYEDSLIFSNFNAEYYSRMNANHSLLPTRNEVVNIFGVIKSEVERTPIVDWINDQRIFDCSIDLGKKVFMLSFTSLSWNSFQHDNRIHFMETHQNGLEWKWGSTDQLGTAEVEIGATWAWTHQLNNTPGDIDFVRDWDNTSFSNRSINNDGHWVIDAGGPYAGGTLLGSHQGANPYYVGATFTRDHEQDNCTAVPGCGKRAWAIGSQSLYTSTSTAANMWPMLVSQGGNVLDARAELNMTESGLFRFEIGFNDASGTYSDSYYRLLGDSFVDIEGVFGGIYSDLNSQVGGRMFVEHEAFGQELDMYIFNNAFKSDRLWTSIVEPLVQYQGGRPDRRYSVPGEIHAVYVDSLCTQKKIDFRTIGYGDGLRGTEMLLFNVEEMEDIIFTQSPDTALNVGDNFNLAVTNNFTDIFAGDTRISYTWVDPSNNPISTDTAFTFINAAVTDTGIYNIQIDFLGCPVFSLPVRVSINPCTSPPLFTTTVNGPTGCGDEDGVINLSGLQGNTTYDVTYNDDGVTMGPFSFITDAQGTISIDTLDQGTYSNIMVDSSGCFTIDVGPYVLTPGTTPNFSVSTIDPTTCLNPDGVITISGLDLNTLYNLSYEVDGVIVGPNTVNSDATGVIMILGLGSGNYSSLTLENMVLPCTSIDNSVYSLVDPSIIAEILPSVVSGLAPLEVLFGNGSSAGDYLWDFGNGEISSLTTPTYVFTEMGEYEVTLTVTDTITYCSTIDAVTIEVNVESILIIPNVFTPNGDGFNDVFTVKSEHVISLKSEIFDRWGVFKFSWDNLNGYWDGANASAGTYFYIINAIDINGEEFLKKGTVNLLR